MPSPRMDRLKNMAANFPVMDEKAERRERGALGVQAQQGIAAAPKSPDVKAQAQQVGTAITGAAGQVGAGSGASALQAGQAGVQQSSREAASQLATAGRQQSQALQTQGIASAAATQQADIDARKEITGRELDQAATLQTMGIDQDNRLLQQSLKQRDDLHKLGSDLNGKLFDSTMRFNKDELGRKFSNERQLMDYAVSKAKSEIELQDTMREMKQASDMEIAMLEAAHAKIKQAMSQKHRKGEQKLDQASRQRLVDAERDMKDKIRKKKQRAGVITAVFTGIGMVAGAPGGAVGVAAGGALGSGVGSVVADKT